MNDVRTAVVIVHETFGPNAHVERVRVRLDRSGRDVFAPHLRGSAERSFDRADEGAAYTSVCCYGSRIRDVTDLPIASPCLPLFAAHEPSFDPRSVVEQGTVSAWA